MTEKAQKPTQREDRFLYSSRPGGRILARPAPAEPMEATDPITGQSSKIRVRSLWFTFAKTQLGRTVTLRNPSGTVATSGVEIFNGSSLNFDLAVDQAISAGHNISDTERERIWQRITGTGRGIKNGYGKWYGTLEMVRDRLIAHGPDPEPQRGSIPISI